MADRFPTRLMILAVSTLAGVGVLAYLAIRRHRQKGDGSLKPVVEVVEVGHVSRLYLYPVKSCAGIELREAECTTIGLKWKELRDRQWMVIDGESGSFVTQRQQSRLALILPSLSDDGKYLVLTNKETLDTGSTSRIMVPMVLPRDSKQRKVRVWDLDNLRGRDCGDEAAAWVTALVGCSDNQSFRLVQLDATANQRRETTRPMLKDLLSKVAYNNPVAFSDISSYMICSESSLEQLNERIASNEKIIMRQFRPNIAVSGVSLAFDESRWEHIEIGNGDAESRLRFKHLKDCHRCVLTTVNPEIGLRREDEEPLKSLREFRLYTGNHSSWRKIFGNSPLFGIQVSLFKAGDIKVGDKVFVSRVAGRSSSHS